MRARLVYVTHCPGGYCNISVQCYSRRGVSGGGVCYKQHGLELSYQGGGGVNLPGTVARMMKSTAPVSDILNNIANCLSKKGCS